MDNDRHECEEMELLAELLECLTLNVGVDVWCDHQEAEDVWRFYCPIGVRTIQSWTQYSNAAVWAATSNPIGKEREAMIADIQQNYIQQKSRYQ